MGKKLKFAKGVWDKAVNELKKPSTYTGTAAVAAGAGSIYDLYKSKGLSAARKEIGAVIKGEGEYAKHLVDTKKYVAERGHRAVTDMEGFNEEMKSDGVGMIGRFLQRGGVRMGGHLEGRNAAAYPTKKPGGFVIASKKMHSDVLNHEMGHVEDFTDAGGAKGFKKKYKPKGWPWQSKKRFETSTMALEREAWRRAPETATKAKNQAAALDTYEKGFHQGRAINRGLLAKSLGELTHRLRTEGGDEEIQRRVRQSVDKVKAKFRRKPSAAAVAKQEEVARG